MIGRTIAPASASASPDAPAEDPAAGEQTAIDLPFLIARSINPD
jgi:hypothetical protein